ncbi:MAG: hypothetical protein IPM79_20970 [Polyangiaceae bacterium]|nr:hypothetical protein [Polyangiaceae bacterium]
MSIDEAIFGWLSRAVTKLTARESAAVQAAAVEVEPLLPRLRVLAGAAAGRPLELRLVDDAGAVSGEVVMLPRRVTALGSAEENERLLIVRATLAGAMVRVASAPGSSSTLGALTAEAEALLLEELPGWASMRAALPATLSLESLVGRLLPRPAPSLHDVRPSDAEQLPSQVTTERDARRRAPPLREKRLLEERGQDNPSPTPSRRSTPRRSTRAARSEPTEGTSSPITWPRSTSSTWRRSSSPASARARSTGPTHRCRGRSPAARRAAPGCATTSGTPNIDDTWRGTAP